MTGRPLLFPISCLESAADSLNLMHLTASFRRNLNNFSSVLPTIYSTDHSA